jgi:hypothetical protein
MGSSMRGSARAWRVATISLVLCGLGACDDDAAESPDAGRRAASAADSATARSPDAAADPDASASGEQRGDCDEAASASGELQSRASGSSVYGRVIGETKLDDPNGMACGVAGVRVCLSENGACTESDAAGEFVLNGLPQAIAGHVTFEASGLRSMLRLVELSGSPVNLFETRMLTQARATQLSEDAGRTVDPKLAAVVAIALAASEAIGGISLAGDVVITLEPGGVEPLYSIREVDESGSASDALDPSLTATRAGGWALFTGQEPGDYTVHFERRGVQCAPFVAGYGHGADERGDIKVTLRGGFTTMAGAFCP